MVDLLGDGVALIRDVALSSAFARLKAHANRNTDALREAMAADARQWRAELDHQFECRLSELEQTATTVISAIIELLSDEQFFRLERNYEFEAARESTNERRRMLAFAAAWSVDPELSIPDLARVERTIRELDPADVDVLKQMADQQASEPRLTRGGGTTYQDGALKEGFEKHHENMYVIWQSLRPAGEVLPAAGCVYISPRATNYGTTTARLEVTRLGLNVLRVLDGYIRSNQLDDTRVGA